MGTLDPNAVGVLPVCLGKATKLCDILSEKIKLTKQHCYLEQKQTHRIQQEKF